MYKVKESEPFILKIKKSQPLDQFVRDIYMSHPTFVFYSIDSSYNYYSLPLSFELNF